MSILDGVAWGWALDDGLLSVEDDKTLITLLDLSLVVCDGDNLISAKTRALDPLDGFITALLKGATSEGLCEHGGLWPS